MKRDPLRTDHDLSAAGKRSHSLRTLLSLPIRVPEQTRRSFFRHGVTAILALAAAWQVTRLPVPQTLVRESEWSVAEIAGPYGRALQFFDQVLPARSTVTVFKDSRFDRTERTRFQAAYLLYPRVVRTGIEGDRFEYFVANSLAAVPRPVHGAGTIVTYHGNQGGSDVSVVFGTGTSGGLTLSRVPAIAARTVVVNLSDGSSIIRVSGQIEGNPVLLVGASDVYEALERAPGVLEFRTRLPVDGMNLSLLRESSPNPSRRSVRRVRKSG